jgi:hypothetical protein
MVMTTMSPRGHHGEHAIKNTSVGYNLMHNIVIMDSESTNRQVIARFLETPPRNGHDDHVPEGSPWWTCEENTCLGVQSHAQLCDHGSGVHESAIIARILDSSPKWSSRPCPQRVTMVDDAIYEFFRLDLLNSYVFRDLDRQNLQ